jgi:hypothetical protein
LRSVGALLADAGEGEVLDHVEGLEPRADAGLLVDGTTEMTVLAGRRDRDLETVAAGAEQLDVVAVMRPQ